MSQAGSNSHIRARRLTLGLAQSELADRAAVTETQLRKWERGLEVPDRDAAGRLADVLGLDAESLLYAQMRYARHVVPGEGYTTSQAGAGQIFERRARPDPGLRRVLDIFCGAGGLSFGFEQTGGFATTCGIDLLPDRIETFLANHAHATGIAGDLLDLPINTLERVTGSVDVVVGGPPCQGFSSIRPFRNLTEGDPRNSLAEHYVLVINRLQPQWFVFENVVGILTHENGVRLQSLLEGFKAAGYEPDWRVVNAAHYGVPQNRERVVIVGNRIGVRFSWPDPTHFVEYKSMAGSRGEVLRTAPLFSQGLRNGVALMEAIDDLPPIEAGEEATEYTTPPHTAYQEQMRCGSPKLTLHRATRHSEKMLEIIRHSGANISALPPGMVTSGFSSCYSRLDPDRPSTTLTVNFVHPASNRCIHPYQDRALSPREGARIQSFPDSFEFRGTAAQIVKQIGNAVPPLLGQRIAEAILESERQSRNADREKECPTALAEESTRLNQSRDWAVS